MTTAGPRGEASASAIEFDGSVPLLIVKVGGYPLSVQGLAAARSLGRMGVPVFTITEDRFTPQAVSRYVTGRFVLPTTGAEPSDVLVAALLAIGRRLGRRAVALPTDDEAAILLAEHATELAPFLIQPPVPPNLPRALSSKRRLSELCRSLGVPTPQTIFPSTLKDIAPAAEGLRFPIVVKNADPWLRLSSPAVTSTTILRTERELVDAAARWPETARVILQEYIPADVAEDWVFHGYVGTDSECLVSFTGMKVRSWPPRAGVTSFGRAVRNERLAEQSRELCRRIGYRGIVDIDWRFDARDDSYKIVDFNPRIGANFRMFQNAAGIDVVRAQHLDLTDRAVPAGPAIEGRGLVVEHLDLPSRAAGHRYRSAEHSYPRVNGSTELAWFATDDPIPFLAMLARTVPLAAKRLARAASRRAGGLVGRRRPMEPGG